jgi:hypothetical protein
MGRCVPEETAAMFKKILFAYLAFICTVLPAAAQYAPPLLQYAWSAPVSVVGPLGVLGTDQYLNFGVLQTGLPVFHTISYAVTGTAPTVCTFRVEGSLDYKNWTSLDVTAPATESCTTGGMFHIPYKPVRGLRINVVAYTAGDGTTSVVFNYAGAK